MSEEIKSNEQEVAISHTDEVRVLLFQILDKLTLAKAKGQLSGPIQVNLHKRFCDIILTMWKDGDTRTKLNEAKKLYKRTTPEKGAVMMVPSAASPGQKELKVFTLTAAMFDPTNPEGKKKRITIDPAKPVGEGRITESFEGMLPDTSKHIRTKEVASDPRPLWKKIMDLGDEQMVEQMGGLGALKSYINGNFQELLPEGKKIHPQARMASTLEKVRIVFDKLKAQDQDVKEKTE